MPKRTAPSSPTVAVIGGGFSGLLTAIHLLQGAPDLTVRLVEKAPQFGRGRAFDAGQPDQLLNVRASNMSAFPDRPSHFQEWLGANGGCAGPDAFVGRRRYGDYLQDLLRETIGDAAGRLLLEQDEAVAVRPAGSRHEVGLALGRSFEADIVILAVGLGPPSQLPGISPDVLSSRAYVANPWRGDLSHLPQGDILLLGSGLTMVDVALALDRPGRNLLALSRHGLLPRPHAVTPSASPPDSPFATPRQTTAALRSHAQNIGWRSAVDSIRPLTPTIWRAWSEVERRRFLRHLQPWWDAHRHRIAPTVAQRLSEPMRAERFSLLAGRLESLNRADVGFEATIRLRGRTLPVTRKFNAVVNCTGLSGDLRSSPLLAQMQLQGIARPDDLKLGLMVDDGFGLIGANARAIPGLYAVGPLTRAAVWEAVAVPDLRSQTAFVAQTAIKALSDRGSLT